MRRNGETTKYRIMNRLLNIGRQTGFPICAETLGILNENNEMLASWLKGIPLKNRQAVLFKDKDYMVVCQRLQNRIVKVGTISAESFSQCKVVFSTENHSVHDSQNNVIEDVWREETADIVDEPSRALQWHIFGFERVFELGLWDDMLSEFASLLPSSTVTGGGGFMEVPTLQEGNNVIRGNNDRVQLNFAINVHVLADWTTILRIPAPFPCRDGVRLNANLKDSTNTNWPVRAMVKENAIYINIGRWLKDDVGWSYHIATNQTYEECIDVITINQEIIL